MNKETWCVLILLLVVACAVYLIILVKRDKDPKIVIDAAGKPVVKEQMIFDSSYSYKYRRALDTNKLIYKGTTTFTPETLEQMPQEGYVVGDTLGNKDNLFIFTKDGWVVVKNNSFFISDYCNEVLSDVENFKPMTVLEEEYANKLYSSFRFDRSDVVFSPELHDVLMMKKEFAGFIGLALTAYYVRNIHESEDRAFADNLTEAPTSKIVEMAEAVINETINIRHVTTIREELANRLKAMKDIEETKKILFS